MKCKQSYLILSPSLWNASGLDPSFINFIFHLSNLNNTHKLKKIPTKIKIKGRELKEKSAKWLSLNTFSLTNQSLEKERGEFRERMSLENNEEGEFFFDYASLLSSTVHWNRTHFGNPRKHFCNNTLFYQKTPFFFVSLLFYLLHYHTTTSLLCEFRTLKNPEGKNKKINAFKTLDWKKLKRLILSKP